MRVYTYVYICCAGLNVQVSCLLSVIYIDNTLLHRWSDRVQRVGALAREAVRFARIPLKIKYNIIINSGLHIYTV